MGLLQKNKAICKDMKAIVLCELESTYNSQCGLLKGIP